jgi:hypothetical protein
MATMAFIAICRLVFVDLDARGIDLAALLDLELTQAHSAAVQKLPELWGALPSGETISTAFVESTINQVVSRRFVKKQQMQWTLKGAHLIVASQNEGAEQRIGGCIPTLVFAISR